MCKGGSPQEMQTLELEGAEGDTGKGGAAWTGPATASIPEMLPGYLDDVTSQVKTLKIIVKTPKIRWIKENTACRPHGATNLRRLIPRSSP